MRDPIVIDPPGFDPKAGWDECREYVEQCGGLAHSDGEPNLRAAAGADPGVCSCPKCGEYYWAWGRVVRCIDCGFEFETNWWAMYSWGVQAAKRSPLEGKLSERVIERLDRLHARRMENSVYYRYGFAHPVESALEERGRIDWENELKSFETA